ncbi:MAG: precorrin-8X methylmutase [Clostridia bacterium]|nr:precorrin-8X methylmutase [Clostridia bacterium]
MNIMEFLKPMDIEKRSFEIIETMLDGRKFNELESPIIKRVIHTSADFDYADNLEFSPNVVQIAIDAIKNGCTIITDTKMAFSGINKTLLTKLHCDVKCYIDDEYVVKEAKQRGITRSAVSMEKAALDSGTKIFAIGNAPTALIKLYELVQEKRIAPALVIGVPVGFVNVIESKELFKTCGVPYIIANGRKGGSNIAAAIVNAVIYMTVGER